MNWLLIALAAPALWAVGNYIDKILIDKYFKGRGVGALVIFSGLIGIFVLPAVYLWQPSVTGLPVSQAAIAIMSGMFGVIAIWLYLIALKQDETSIIVPLFQTIPVFAFILGYFFLGEILTIRQAAGSILILTGAVLLSLKWERSMPKPKVTVLLLMLLSSFLIALSGLLFKWVALDANFWATVFWGYAGDMIIGLLFFACLSGYRREFLGVIRTNALPIVSLNILNEFLYMVGVLIFRFAMLLAPLALVQTINGFQPLFVLILGILLSVFFPRLVSEDMRKGTLSQKILSILIIFVGTYLIST